MTKKTKKDKTLTAHMFKIDCMNYEQSFRGATVESVESQAKQYIEENTDMFEDGDSFILLYESTHTRFIDVEHILQATIHKKSADDCLEISIY